MTELKLKRLVARMLCEGCIFNGEECMQAKSDTLTTEGDYPCTDEAGKHYIWVIDDDS